MSPATCSDKVRVGSVLFEPHVAGLPGGLLASPALVQVDHGTAYIPVVNVGEKEVVLHPRTILGKLSDVFITSLPTGVAEVRTVYVLVPEQVASDPIKTKILELDLSPLSDLEQYQVRSMLLKYSSVFVAHDGDLGCSNLIFHEFSLVG